MSVLRFDPFRDFDRLVAEQMAGLRGAPRSVPIDAYRRGDQFLIHLDLPGVDPDAIELTVEQNVLTIRAERRFEPEEGDELVISERPQGTFTRQLLLGDSLDRPPRSRLRPGRTHAENPGCRGSEAASRGDHKERRRPASDRRGPSSTYVLTKRNPHFTLEEIVGIQTDPLPKVRAGTAHGSNSCESVRGQLNTVSARELALRWRRAAPRRNARLSHADGEQRQDARHYAEP